VKNREESYNTKSSGESEVNQTEGEKNPCGEMRSERGT